MTTPATINIFIAAVIVPLLWVYPILGLPPIKWMHWYSVTIGYSSDFELHALEKHSVSERPTALFFLFNDVYCLFDYGPHLPC
jgi:hypothetical protein